MNALGAFVGEGTDSSRLNRCAALFSGPSDIRTLALKSAGVFALSKHAAVAPSLSSASFEKLIVAADARIDGRIELGESLRMSPQQAAAAPAAELIARAWARWGEEALQHLLGDFAFLLWDGNSRSLTLARDFFGERPLHYRLERQGILASTVPSAGHQLTGTSAT